MWSGIGYHVLHYNCWTCVRVCVCVFVWSGWDDMFAKLDEHLSALSSMKASQFYKVFEEEAGNWDDKLTRIRYHRRVCPCWVSVAV